MLIIPWKNDGYLFIEVRGINDELYGKGENVGRDEYIFDGHYRRFIRKEELEKALTDIGFKIVLSVEDIDFAPFENENPKVIRIVAEKRV